MIHTQLPPLNAIRAFDAVVQQGSVAEGAALLCVSQSAVSRHIKNLEEFLGCRLMQRNRNGVVLTSQGRQFHTTIHAALIDIFDATTTLRQADADFQIIRISAPSSFALRWLVPRIAHFQANNLGIALDVSISDNVPAFDDSGIDCAIVSAAKEVANDDEVLLFPEQLELVCAPALIEKAPMANFGDINNYTMLHTSTRNELWGQWRQQYGVSSRQTSDSDLMFQDFYITIAAAIAGIGIALVPAFLVEEELAQHRLVSPVHAPLNSGRNYRLVTASRRKDDTAMTVFKNWIINQVVD
ncbi:MAG: LysR substrate-binding domain-containing protein [Halioglobus sp.]